MAPGHRRIDRGQQLAQIIRQRLRDAATAEIGARLGNLGEARCNLIGERQLPVGFAEIRLRFEVATGAGQDKLDLLLKLTERYCVVYQTIKNGPKVSVSMKRI